MKKSDVFENFEPIKIGVQNMIIGGKASFTKYKTALVTNCGYESEDVEWDDEEV